MVKIRLRRIGTKGRPFYRVVVAQSTAGRNGKFVETIGLYDPIVKPTRVEINEDRALHWLRSGAQPSETTAYLLNKVGILEKYFEDRPKARKNFGFLDKRTAASSVASVMDKQAAAPKVEAKAAPAPTPEPEPVQAADAAPVEAVAEVATEAPVEAPVEPATEATAELPVEEAPAAEADAAAEKPE